MRASTSAWPSGESLGKSEACCGALLAGSEKGPPRSAAAKIACLSSGASGVVIAPDGASVATADARAARRANSRREMPFGADSSLGSSLIIDLYALVFMVRKEATERVREGQPRRQSATAKRHRAETVSAQQYVDHNSY